MKNDYEKKPEHKRRKTTRFSLGIGTRCNTPNDTICKSNGTGQNQKRRSNHTVQHILFAKRKQSIFTKQSDTETPEDLWE